MLGEVQQLHPAHAVERGLLEQHDEVGVKHDVLRGLVVEHRNRVLGDSSQQQAELAPLVGEAREVVEHRRVGEERLHLLDVEPCADVALRVEVHAVSHSLADVDEGEDQHGIRQVLEVEVHDAGVEVHVGLTVEEVHGTLDEPLIAKGDGLRLMLGLLKGDVVEVLQGRRKAVAALFGTLERKLHAALDDGLVNLGEGLTGFGCGGTRLRQHRVDFERNLLGSRHVLHGHRVEWVQERIRAHTEVVGGAAVALGDGRVLTGAVDDVNLIRGVGEDGARHLGLGEHALARTRLAADEAHGAGQLLAVAHDEVAGVLVLAVVVAARIVKLLRGEGHEDGDLRGGEHAADFDMVVAEGQHGVESPALPVVVGVHLDGVLPRGGDDAHDLSVELLFALRVGVDKAGEDVEALVLVLQVVENVFCLLLGIFKLLRQDGEVVALVHGAALLLDNLLVNPCASSADEVDGLGLVHGLNEPRDRHGKRKVNDVRERTVGKLGAELLHDQDLTIHPVVQLEAVVEHAVRSPVNLRRGDAVLSGLHALGGDVLLVVEVERLVGIQERMDDRQPLGAVHQVGLGPHGIEDAAGFRLDSGELASRVVRRLGGDRIGQVAVAADVGNALAHLVVQDVVEHLRVVAGGVVALTGDIEELAVADLLLEQGRVDDAHLDQRVRAELVIQSRERGEHGFLLLVAHGVVAGVAEGDGGGEQALLDLADAVLVHAVVADVVHHVLRALALAACVRRLRGEFLVAVLELGLHGRVALAGLFLGQLRLLLEACDLPFGLLLLPAGHLLASHGGSTGDGAERRHIDRAVIGIHGAVVAEPLPGGVDELLDVEVRLGVSR